MNSSKKLVYLDHNATTPLDGDLVEMSMNFMEVWGNPSSIHWAGREPKALMRESRTLVSNMIKATSLEIIFNSGGSEGNNSVIKGVFEHFRQLSFDHKISKNHYMCSTVEHPSVLKTMKFLEHCGAQVDYIPVSREGDIDLDFYESRLTEHTALVSVMFANNEIGSIFPIKKMAKMAHEKGVLFHSDMVQALGKINIDVGDLGVDYATFSAHKFYSVKGTGFLFCKKGSPYVSLIHGGGQERQRRGGTENIFGIACLGNLVKNKASEIEDKITKMKSLRDYFESEVLSRIQGVSITAKNSYRLSNTSSLILDGVDGETLLISLDLKGFAVSTGAACSSGSPEPSPVLLALGLSKSEAQNSLRVSLGWNTTLDEINLFLDALCEVVNHLRNLKSS